MIFLFWFINFSISWFNAWACGRSWHETKHLGGMPHFINWCGAIMSACGFTWCYLVIAVYFGQFYMVEQDDGTEAALMSPEEVRATAEFGYLMIIGPILGSGLAITIQAWVAAWRRRTIADMGVAAWDTFAMVYNLHGAFTHVPGAVSHLKGFLGDSDSRKGLVYLFAIGAVLGGILTTYTILTRTAEKVRQKARWENAVAHT